MQFLQGLDTFRGFSRISRPLGALPSPQQSDLELRATPFLEEKHATCFQTIPKRNRCESFWYSVFNGSQRSRNPTASGCHPTRPRHLSPRRLPSSHQDLSHQWPDLLWPSSPKVPSTSTWFCPKMVYSMYSSVVVQDPVEKIVFPGGPLPK